jgi:Xaa-Pro aminopeptidase
MNVGRFNQLCRRRGHDAAVATSVPNVLYSAGYFSSGSRVFSIVIPGDPPRVLLVLPTGSVNFAVEQVADSVEIYPYGEFFIEGLDSTQPGINGRLARIMETAEPADPLEALSRALRCAGLEGSKLLVDEAGLLPAEWGMLSKMFHGAVDPGYPFWREVRMVKTPAEVELLRKAATITYTTIDYCLANVREGMTERETVTMYQKYLLDQGADIAGSIILFGDHSVYSRGLAGVRRLRKGDIIRFDSGCLYGNYVADLARTAVFAKMDEVTLTKVSLYHRAMLTGVREAIRSVKPGVLARDVFGTAVESVRRAGVPHFRRTHCGHSIGLETYDAFVLGANADIPLEPGMVLCVETPYYEIGLGGIQVEDTIVVTECGAEYLSPPSRELEFI